MRRRRPVVVGLTGPIASGKSTVAAHLESLGAEIIDADRVYHSLITPQSDLWKSIVDRFGPRVVAADESIDRQVLGTIVFNDPASLADLERITHPAVVAEIERRVAESTADVIVVEAIKLVQSGLADKMDEVWLVTADREIRVRRLMSRSGLNRAAAAARAAASQAMPDTFIPGVTIDTSGSLDETIKAVDRAWLPLRTKHFGEERFTAAR